MQNPFSSAQPPHVDDSDLFLIAGDASDLGAIRERLRGLPRGARGQVFIEVFAPIQIARLEAPEGVGVNWVLRDTREHDGMRRAVAPRGAGLVRAIDAWLNEWMRAEAHDHDNYRLWIGACTSSTVNSYYTALARELAARDRVRTPRLVNPLRADAPECATAELDAVRPASGEPRDLP